MTYAANDNLEEDITALATRHYTSGTGFALRSFFNRLAMPVPLRSEIVKTSDRGFILFLNDPAILIRFSDPKICTQIVHDNILQPFGTIPLGQLRADFFPGVISPVAMESVKDIGKNLERAKVLFLDRQTLNCGYIPLLEDHGVVIDMGAILLPTHSDIVAKFIMNKVSSLIPRKHSLTPVQTEYYRSLRQAFRSAWPDARKSPDAQNLAALWQECLSMKDKGKLVASWMNPSEGRHRNYKNIIASSTLYAQRWSICGQQKQLLIA